MINAAPNPEYEAWCEEQPSGQAWDGDYIETMYALDGRLVQCGGFTRYRGEIDLAGYGEMIVDRDVWGPAQTSAAYFMAA